MEDQKQNVDKDAARLQFFKEYENGDGVGTVDRIRNVTLSIWKDFKDISRLYGNNEGAAFAACVLAWQEHPVHMAKLLEARDRIEARRQEAAHENAGEVPCEQG